MPTNFHKLLFILFLSPAMIFHSPSAVAQTSGCGSRESWYLLRIGTPISASQFKAACNEHDDCYDTYGKSKQECDDAFRKRTNSICSRDHKTLVERPLKIQCFAMAKTYYIGVRDLGQSAYENAQAAAFRTSSLTRRQDIIQIYREILGRNVDPSGMDTWTRELESGRSVSQVRRAIAESPEAQSKLNELYQRMLGRDIDASGRTRWTNALANGWTIQKVANEGIAPSPEYRRQDVIRIYREILGRDVDPSGMDTWARELENGRSVLEVRRAIAESPEAQNKLNKLYQRMLCRDVDPSGRATWTNALASGWSLQKVANEGIAPSPEYQSRAGRSCN